MELKNLTLVLQREPKYRLLQVKQTLFRDLISNWQEAFFLPLGLRNLLNSKCPLELKTQTTHSADKNTLKVLITLKDGLKIESVLMRHNDNRNTVCVSCQVGCPLACSFCLTGKIGFKRNLSSSEIIDQVLYFSRLLKKDPPSASWRSGQQKITNIVFMGMGEPFLNYDNVLQAIRILNDKEGFNLGARRFSISTAGIIEGIDKLGSENLEINLAISLHAPNDELRSKLMPINKKYPLKEVLKAVDNYIEKTNRKVMFEYLMIKGINDSEECALELASLMRKRLYLVNLITYNPTGVFTPSPQEQINKFKNILEQHGVAVTQRFRFGEDIQAACGQLAGN